MKTYKSVCVPGGPVSFPEWRGERHYMVPFSKSEGLPASVRRYSDTVRQMMEGVSISLNTECYLMVDEAEVLPGLTHRRPGLHVDGYWHPGILCHGSTPSHGPRPYPGHSPSPSHSPVPGRHSASGGYSEALLLASSHSACRAYLGNYSRDFEGNWAGGDCSDLDLSGLSDVMLYSSRVYRLDVFSLHESLPVVKPVRRTLVRINAPCA